MEAFSQWCRRYRDSEMFQVSVPEACAAIHHAETNSENMDEDSWNSKGLMHVQLAMLHMGLCIEGRWADNVDQS